MNTGEGRKFEKVGTLRGKIQEEKKPPDETVFETVFEDSEVEETGREKNAIEGSMEGDSEGTMKGVLTPKEPQIKVNGSKRLEDKVLVLRFEFYKYSSTSSPRRRGTQRTPRQSACLASSSTRPSTDGVAEEGAD